MKLGRALAVEHAPALAANAIRSSYFIVRANARHTVVGDPMDQVAFNGHSARGSSEATLPPAGQISIAASKARFSGEDGGMRRL